MVAEVPKLQITAKVACSFWRRVDKAGPVRTGMATPCWVWIGQIGTTGYGVLDRGPRLRWRAHRLSWELHHGPIREGLFVCHHCDNPPCVNPAHLFLGTNADNIADMRAKGRAAVGESTGSAKLTEQQVREIRSLALAGRTARMLARDYGVSIYNIHAIVQRKTWRHVAATERKDRAA